MAFTKNIESGKVYQWSQEVVTPSALWVFNHGLGKKPAVITIDSGGTQVFGKVTYTSDNIIQIEFGAPFGGWCYLS